MKQINPRTSYSSNCFDSTLEVASENHEASVVHGWLYSDNQWILHAWCEIGEEVIDLTETRAPIPKNDYYTAMGVTEERLRRYTRLEFFTLFTQEKHYGPFDKDFFYREISKRDPLTL
ncbi:MAG: hypothetical protein MJE63_28960 [Proteobacteria bacterium]|nr:hypothetical protein [Pseudomonadota bacterium]